MVASFKTHPDMIKNNWLLALLLLSTSSFAQDNSAWIATHKYVRDRSIQLNTLQVPAGYTVYYNCDSLLFVRGNFGDTIKIWTLGMQWAHTLGAFKEVKKNPEFGRSVFIKSVLSDGRILVDFYRETMFIHRRDSLYELVDTSSKPAEYTTMIVDRTMGFIDDARFKQMKDSLDSIYAGKHTYSAKLIFTATLFSRGKPKVKLSKTLNFEEDEIILERTWKEDNKTCYLIRINNYFGKEKTSYAFNEDMKFVWWEDCQLNSNRK